MQAEVTRMERVQMSYDSENLVAKLRNGVKSAHRDPIDVITPTEGIEVKAMHKQAKIHRCKMTREAIKRKQAFCRKNKLKGKTVMAVVNDMIELYERKGFGNWTKESMEFIGRYSR